MIIKIKQMTRFITNLFSHSITHKFTRNKQPHQITSDKNSIHRKHKHQQSQQPKQSNIKFKTKCLCFLLSFTFLLQTLGISLIPITTIFALDASSGGSAENGSANTGSLTPDADIKLATEYIGYLVSFVEIETESADSYGTPQITSEQVIGTSLVTTSQANANTLSNSYMYLHNLYKCSMSKLNAIELLNGGGVSDNNTSINLGNFQLSSISLNYGNNIIISDNIYKLSTKTKTDTEAMFKYYIGVGAGETGGSIQEPLQNLLDEILNNDGVAFTNTHKYDKEYVLNILNKGSLVIHVEPILAETSPYKIAYTAAQLGVYALDKTTSSSSIVGGNLRQTPSSASSLYAFGGKYLGWVPFTTDAFLYAPHLTTANTKPGILQQSASIQGWDTLSDIPKTTNSDNQYKLRPYELITKIGIYTIRFASTITSQPPIVNIPNTDFMLTELEAVVDETGSYLNLETGEIKLKVVGGYNGEEFPWQEPTGKIEAVGLPSDNINLNTRSVAFTFEERSMLDTSPTISEFSNLQRAIKSITIPQEEIDNVEVEIQADGSRIASELQENVRKLVEDKYSEQGKEISESEEEEVLDFTALELEWKDADLTTTDSIIPIDERIEFQVYLKTESQVLANSSNGLVSTTQPLIEILNQQGMDSLSGNTYVELSPNKNSDGSYNDDGTVSLFIPTDNKELMEEIDKSSYILATAWINYVPVDDRTTHYYEGDQWKRTESTEHKDGGYGWDNNYMTFKIEIPRPNFTAVSIEADYDASSNELCGTATGILAELPSYLTSISTEHKITITNENGDVLFEKVLQAKDLQLNDELKFEFCFTLPELPSATKETEYFVTYEINPDQDQPKAETTFDDNYTMGSIIIGGEFNWEATNISIYPNLSQTGTSAYIYDLTLIGKGELDKNSISSKVPTATSYEFKIWIGDNKDPIVYTGTTDELLPNETTQESPPETIRVSVPVDTTVTVRVQFTLNYDKDLPEYESTYDDNTIETSIVLGGPISAANKPISLDPPTVTSFDCVYPTQDGDIELSDVGYFQQDMPREETWGYKLLETGLGSYTNLGIMWHSPISHYTYGPSAGAQDIYLSTAVREYAEQHGISNYSTTDILGASLVPYGEDGYTNFRSDGIPDIFQVSVDGYNGEYLNYLQAQEDYDNAYSSYITAKEQYDRQDSLTEHEQQRLEILRSYAESKLEDLNTAKKYLSEHLVNNNPLDYTYTYFVYDKDTDEVYLKRDIVERFKLDKNDNHSTYYITTDEDGNPYQVWGTCVLNEVYELNPTLTTQYLVKLDTSYTNNTSNSRTYATESLGTKYDKIFTSGKGIQTTVRVKILTDWNYDMNWGGHFVYSMASGENNHNKEVFNKTTPMLEVTSTSTAKATAYNDYNYDPNDIANDKQPSNVGCTTKSIRKYTFNLEKNTSSKGNIREVYTNVNYPEGKVTGTNSFTGLKTKSVVYLYSVKTPISDETKITSTTNTLFGMCYNDNLFPISNYYNDMWASEVTD